MSPRFAVFAIILGTAACSGDPHPVGTPPAAGSADVVSTAAATASAAASTPSSIADAEDGSPPKKGIPAHRKETETGVPAAYSTFCTGKLTAPVTILRDDGKVSFSGWDEKAPVGTEFLLSVNSYNYTGYFVTSNGHWALLGLGDTPLDPAVNFSSSCLPKTRPAPDKLPHVTIGNAKLFADESFKGQACDLKGGMVMTGYGYMAWANESAKVWSNEIKATCKCDNCYSPDVHVDRLIPK
ncbi:MAG: hypothetical protein IPK82_29075 [Polyangiaceae bacterium]|nr:hypothetical protein [Polyangiaceae bacterium]